jgi:hypothetical protein
MASQGVKNGDEWRARFQDPPEVDELNALIYERVRIAYDAALSELARQDQTLSNIRNRATGTLTVATLVTSLAVGLGFLRTSNSAGPTFPTWARWTLFAILLAIVLLHLVINWPVKRIFGASPGTALWAGETPVDNPIRRAVVETLIRDGEKNEIWNTVCARLYEVQAFALVTEVIIIIIATLRG